MTSDSGSPENDVPRGVTFPLIAICFLLSGFAALLYETVWLRQFAIILGTSEQALAVILASYMGGLSIGSLIAGRTVDRVIRPLWLYGVLEGGIALCAIAMPWGLSAVESLQVQFFGGSQEPPAAGSLSQVCFGLSSAFALILPPTAMMGATLPLLAKYVVHRNRDVGPRIGVLYGINTFGAVAGTLAAAFVFLPSLGLRQTTWIGAAINLAIFVLICLVARPSVGPSDKPGTASGQADDEALQPGGDLSPYRLILWFAALAGAVAFGYEIVFTRMLSHVLGGSIYAFATMLAGFLLGIALGGTIASRMAIRRDRSVVALVYAQSLAGISALFAYQGIESVAGWSLSDWGGPSATFSQVMVSIVILLPTATFIGATFPLATRILARDQTVAAASAARVYFWNTLGGIAGALVTGTYILPSLAYRGSTSFAILVNACVALALVWCMRARWVHLAAGILTVILLAIWTPSVPDRVMRISALSGEPIKGELIYSRVGRSGTVTLFDQQGDIRFLTNGLPEAIVAQRGSRDGYAASGAWLSALPPLMRSECESMLIIGLGGGTTAAYVPPSVDEIDIFELEPVVVEANEFVRRLRDRDPLADPRVKIILNDGRNGLALTAKKYDAIVSQPSHPWTAGASHLYTREFTETVRDRLSDEGIFLQWMNTDFVNPELYRSLAATLLDVFPHVRVYEPFVGISLFVASGEPVHPEAVSGPALALDPRDLVYYQDFGIQNPTHLFAMLRIEDSGLRKLAAGASLITDESNLLAMKAPSLLANKDPEGMQDFIASHSVYHSTPKELRSLCPTLNPVVYGLRILGRDLNFNPELVSQLIDDSADVLLYRAMVAKKDGRMQQWADLLREMAVQHPGDPRPAFLLLAHSRLGTYKSLQQEEADELAEHLDDRYRQLLAAVDAVSRNDLAALRQYETQLASYGIDEVGYELAVRMRILWRITDGGPSRQQSNREALGLVSAAVPFLGDDAMIPFRVAAAIGAGQPEVALASSVAYAKSVVERIQRKEITEVSRLESLRSNLVKCQRMIADPRPFQAVPEERHSRVLDYLTRVISGDVE